jgi:hypothetical protein
MNPESVPLPPSPVDDQRPSEKQLAIRTRLEERKAMAPIRVKKFMDLPVDIKTLIVHHVSEPCDQPRRSHILKTHA